ncbi:hypothetical protein KIN20_012554 [Parelaphostrongylus tenuis]|uniref:Uncharacterized protein n=1 Tax=Parelaphostrongylus tenuis TaxID=148309 RepID=A0AAD5N163_PARTN|nr:hypothetical protein KIN20_012554 [Parelaphostrongylus tenuis]
MNKEERKEKQMPIVIFNTQAKEIEVCPVCAVQKGESGSDFYSGLRIREVVNQP